jgi:acyl-CoA reductase-like NAD-dependent aldehyde dehydrogenase
MTLDTQSRCALPAKGYWFPPTFLTGVTHAHRVASEEIFGPLGADLNCF